MTHYEKQSMNVAAGESKANSFALPSCSNVTERKELRAGMGEGLVEAGKRNENVVALSADVKGSVKMK